MLELAYPNNHSTPLGRYGTSEKASEVDLVPILRMNHIQNGGVLLKNLKYRADALEELPTLFLKSGDLLFNRTNSYELVGKTGVFKVEQLLGSCDALEAQLKSADEERGRLVESVLARVGA